MKLTYTIIEKLKVRIISALNYFTDWKIEEIDFINNGVINAVFLVKEKNLGSLAVRTPWSLEDSDIISLKKEAAIVEHCHKFNIPVPKVHKLFLSNEINFLVSDFVSGDAVEIPSFDIGQLISQIHKVPLEGLAIVDQKDRQLSNIISYRITDRTHSLSKHINSEILIPDTNELEAILHTSQIKDCLLHLDVRPPNLIGENGSIKAIIDWDNAFIGNPVMELMRISETKELNVEGFLQGYENIEIIENSDIVVQSIYRLDTALMLTILFTSIIKDSQKRKFYLNRVHFLSNEIRKNL